MRSIQIRADHLFNIFTYHRHLIKIVVSTFLVSCILLLISCDPNRVYETNTQIDATGWLISNKVPFEMEVTDTLALLNFYINIRHTTDYKYRNIFLFVDTFFPEGSQSRDTVEIILADARGKWFGKGIGNIRSNQVLLKRGFSFPMKGHYKFRLEQGMREQELLGITDVGIRIEKM